MSEPEINWTLNPCADGHPELKLLIEVTSFSDRLPVMHCGRCGENLSFEEAVRNDERLRWARAEAEQKSEP